MNVTVRIPDDLARRIAAAGDDPGRRALEGLVVEEFRAGRISKDELRDALGFAVLDEVDGFLKARGVHEPYTLEELDREVQALERLDSPAARIRAFRAGKTLGGLDPMALIREGRR